MGFVIIVVGVLYCGCFYGCCCSGGRVNVVFLDASHDLDSVWADLNRVLDHIQPRFIVFDDYSAEEGVQKAVNLAIHLKMLEPLAHLGEKDYPVRDGRTIEGFEGVVCAVRERAHWEREA